VSRGVRDEKMSESWSERRRAAVGELWEVEIKSIRKMLARAADTGYSN